MVKRVDLARAVERINVGGGRITLDWAYGRPRVANADGGRFLFGCAVAVLVLTVR